MARRKPSAGQTAFSFGRPVEKPTEKPEASKKPDGKGPRVVKGALPRLDGDELTKQKPTGPTDGTITETPGESASAAVDVSSPVIPTPAPVIPVSTPIIPIPAPVIPVPAPVIPRIVLPEAPPDRPTFDICRPGQELLFIVESFGDTESTFYRPVNVWASDADILATLPPGTTRWRREGREWQDMTGLQWCRKILGWTREFAASTD